MTTPSKSKAAEAAAPAADVTGSILLIAVTDIDMGERLRPVDPVWAAALGQIMARDGQLTPIDVCRLPGKTRWTLVAGGHRLTGLQSAGLLYARAIEVTNDRAERELREVSENLWRRDLAPVDRASFIARMVELQKVKDGIDPAKDGRVVSAGARWQKLLSEDATDANDTMSFAYGWSDKIAERLGVSKRTIERDLLLHRRIYPGELARLREADHPILNSAGQLRALAMIDGPDTRAEIVAMLLAGTVKTVGEGLSVMRQTPKPSPEQKRLNTILSTLARMSLTERQGLIQSDQFQALLPKAARDLLAPLLHTGDSA